MPIVLRNFVLPARLLPALAALVAVAGAARVAHTQAPVGGPLQVGGVGAFGATISSAPYRYGGRQWHALAGAELRARGVPLGVRAEAMATNGNADVGPLTLSALAFVEQPIGPVALTLLGGGGVYGVGGVGKRVGASAGVQLAPAAGRFRPFLEYRAHTARNAVVSLGARF